MTRSEYQYIGKKIVCPDCWGTYYPLGIMRHRGSSRCRQNALKKFDVEKYNPQTTPKKYEDMTPQEQEATDIWYDSE